MIDPDAHRRLQAALNIHRRRAKRLGLPSEDVRVEALLAKSATDLDGRYLCYATGRVLDFRAESVGLPNKATVGHVFPLSAPDPNRLHPGHTLDNIELESWANNERQNNQCDTPEIARGKRMSVQRGRPKSGSIPAPRDPWNSKFKQKIGGRVVER